MKKIYFYAGHHVDFKWVFSTLKACRDLGLNVCYGCVYGIEDVQQSPYFLKNIPFFYGKEALRVKADIVISASSGLSKASFRYGDFFSIHMPHSLISLHMAYPEDAFDDVDLLFAAGPHHGNEWDMINEKRFLKKKPWFAVGYGFFDLLQHALCVRAPKRILIAPSWGEDNLLESSALSLAQQLLSEGYDVILRPHPLFFVDKKDVLEHLQKICPTLTIESSLDQKNDGFYTSSFLITDYSGIAFEYAFFHHRKVIFVDTPMKKAHDNWKRDPIFH